MLVCFGLFILFDILDSTLISTLNQKKYRFYDTIGDRIFMFTNFLGFILFRFSEYPVVLFIILPMLVRDLAASDEREAKWLHPLTLVSWFLCRAISGARLIPREAHAASGAHESARLGSPPREDSHAVDRHAQRGAVDSRFRRTTRRGTAGWWAVHRTRCGRRAPAAPRARSRRTAPPRRWRRRSPFPAPASRA